MDFFKNNGKLRGLLYCVITFLAVFSEDLAQWKSNNGPENLYAVALTLVSAIAASLMALRAYLDQHLGRNRPGPTSEILRGNAGGPKPKPPPAIPRDGALMILAGALLFTGCASNGGREAPAPAIEQDAQIQRMVTFAKLAAYNGAGFYLLEHPASRQHFSDAVDAMDTLLIEGDFDPVRFAEVLNQLAVQADIRELQGEQGMLLIGSAVLMWEEYGAQRIELDRMVYVAPVIKAVRDGLRRALVQTQ